LLIIISIFTSFYAGINTIFELDLKKLIALSTLRHLGFISIAFASGLLHLRFFHLLVHALFKSVLFMSIGDIIININHSQDIRYLSKGRVYVPFSSTVIRVSIINLLGIPNISGYFSKDLILETMNFRSSSLFVIVVLYSNILFTYYYSYKLLYFSFQSVKLNPFQTFHSPLPLHSILIVCLRLLTLIFSSIFINLLYQYTIFYCIVPAIKFIPLVLNFITLTYLFLALSLPSPQTKSYFAYFSSILYLSNLAMGVGTTIYIKYLFNSVKSLEIGLLNTTINTLPRLYLKSLSSLITLSLVKIQHRRFILLFRLVFLITLSLSI